MRDLNEKKMCYCFYGHRTIMGPKSFSLSANISNASHNESALKEVNIRNKKAENSRNLSSLFIYLVFSWLAPDAQRHLGNQLIVSFLTVDIFAETTRQREEIRRLSNSSELLSISPLNSLNPLLGKFTLVWDE